MKRDRGIPIAADPGVEIDVGVEVSFDEVSAFFFFLKSVRKVSCSLFRFRVVSRKENKHSLVLGRGLLQRHGHLQRRVVRAAQVREQLPRHALHHRRARVVRLVHPVPEAEEPPGVVLVFRARERLGDVFDAADVDEHAQAGLVGAAVGRAPERGDARGDAGEGVGLRRARGADSGGACVLVFLI